MKSRRSHTKKEIAILLFLPVIFLLLTILATVTGNLGNWILSWRNAGNSILNSADTLWINIEIIFIKTFRR
jgi:hypothetical protein